MDANRASKIAVYREWVLPSVIEASVAKDS
jgi:hypothetical protein